MRSSIKPILKNSKWFSIGKVIRQKLFAANRPPPNGPPLIGRPPTSRRQTAAANRPAAKKGVPHQGCVSYRIGIGYRGYRRIFCHIGIGYRLSDFLEPYRVSAIGIGFLEKNDMISDLY
jgi:hypothetical protein